ncbi:MAG: hypothetical protein V4450_12690 [Bacteroidota bacterium]
MRKILLGTILLVALFAVLTSCQKEVHQSEKIKEITIDTTISTGTQLYLDMTPYGNDEDVASLLEKGNYFSVSQLEDVTDMFTAIYHYAPAAKFIGTDSITLSVSQNPIGRTACSKDSTIIYLNVTVK